jgi:diguanylate cyclase (GGDEF)-like protein
LKGDAHVNGLLQLRGPLLAGALWSALAFASMYLQESLGAVPLIWLPSAVAVASLYATPERRWPPMLGILACFQIAMSLALGQSIVTAVGFAVASLTEATICATLGIRRLGGRASSPQSFRDITGLFAAAMLGGAAGALIALPFRPDQGLMAFGWWFLSTTLAVLAAAPVLLYARHWIGFGEQDVRFWRKDVNRGFFPTVAAMFGLGVAVFTSPFAALLPLLFVAIVFAVIRFGQFAAASGVLAYAAAATVVSLGGDSPAPFLAADPAIAGPILQALMMLMLATGLPIAAMLMTRDGLEARLREQNSEMRENLTILNLAESLAGIGRWRYDLRTGSQHWSPLMLELNGLPRALAPDPGNIREFLPDSGEQLFGAISAHREDSEPYSFEYSISPRRGGQRTLKMHVTNEFDENGDRVALFAVAMDVTEQVRREEALHRAREQAIGLAAEAQKLANTDTLTGLANRRCALDWLDRLVKASEEVDEPLAALIFDIDHFKRINDTFGHKTGDDVLRRVAELARAQLRTEDLVGRIGGEEFVCILPGLTAPEARGLAERLCNAIAEGSGSAGLPRATISVGLAARRPADTPEGLLARADAALYKAKESGRNQVRRAA